MTVNHLSELLIRRKTLPLEAGAPVLKEAPCPTLALVTPQLTEGLLEQVGGMQAFIRGQQRLQRLSPLQVQVLTTREQGVLLTLDVAPLFARESGVLALAYLIQRLAQVAHDVELVEQDGRLRRLLPGRITKGLPHVHHRQANAPALLVSEPGIELRHARLRAVLAPEPDRAHPDQIAHHDAIGVPLADRDFVDADGLGSGGARPGQLCRHVLLLQRLDRVPVEMQLLGHVLDRRLPATPAHVKGEALGVQRIVGQEVKRLPLHLAAGLAMNAPDFEVQVNTGIGTGQVAYPAYLPIVPTAVPPATGATSCFFERRARVITRAFGSPKTPLTFVWGRNPGKVYASRRRLRLRGVVIRKACQFSSLRQPSENLYRPALSSCRTPFFTHTITR